MTYASEYQQSIDHPEEYWAKAASTLHWNKPWDQVLDRQNAPLYRWFSGGQINTCFNALDRHVDGGRAEQTAIIYDSPVTGVVRHISYAELLADVAQFAGALTEQGVQKGDRVVIYMPMVPEAAVAMLACARIGAIHSVVFGGFAAPELAKRIDAAKPTLVLAASCGIEPGRIVEYKPLLDEALELAQHKVQNCVVLQREQSRASMTPRRDLDWQDFAANAEPAGCSTIEATDPLYVLYTSGTTGKPKGVVRDHGSHAVALTYSLKAVYDINPGDVFWAASDIGWVVGHSYIVYGPLLHGATAIMFEGKPIGTPDAGAYWRVISEHKVKALFTAPTAFRAIKKEDPKANFLEKYDVSSLKTLFLAGERSDPDTINWAGDILGVPVVDHWWQTELGWPAIANCQGIEPMPIKPGSSSVPVPGFNLQVLDDDGNELPRGEIGNLVIKLPLAPGSLSTMWENEQGYVENYLSRYRGYYLTGDAGFIDEDGYVSIMSRIDDIINVAGHRLSTGGMEEVICAHPDIAECAVIGVADSLKGQIPVGLAVLKSGVDRPSETICAELVAKIREDIGAVAAFKQAAIVARLPKTRSGKVLRATMRSIANGADYAVPATIDDPAILQEITDSLSKLGLPRT